jgi:hypothetical protein
VLELLLAVIVDAKEEFMEAALAHVAGCCQTRRLDAALVEPVLIERQSN